VQFISDFYNVNLLNALLTRAGGESIFESDFQSK